MIIRGVLIRTLQGPYKILIRSLYTPGPFRRKTFIRNESLEPPRTTRITSRTIRTTPISSPPWGGLLICMVLMVREAILVFLGVVLVVLEVILVVLGVVLMVLGVVLVVLHGAQRQCLEQMFGTDSVRNSVGSHDTLQTPD